VKELQVEMRFAHMWPFGLIWMMNVDQTSSDTMKKIDSLREEENLLLLLLGTNVPIYRHSARTNKRDYRKYSNSLTGCNGSGHFPTVITT